MVAKRNQRDQAPRPAREQRPPPPAPGAEWLDPEEFKAFWGKSVEEIIDEISVARLTERGATRGDDRFSEAAMEDRKKEGYF